MNIDNDYEINKAITVGMGLWYDSKSMWGSCKVIDYCTNWDALMPLVIEYNISMIKLSTGMYSCHRSDSKENETLISHTVECKNPQRALAECLLKVLQNK